jgi:hypothetical protein
MPYRRRVGAPDANQAALRRALDQVPGVSTARLLIDGCDDLLVGYAGRNYVLEVKNPDRPPSRHRLTEAEAKLHQRWRGQVDIVFTLADALRVLGITSPGGPQSV